MSYILEFTHYIYRIIKYVKTNPSYYVKDCMVYKTGRSPTLVSGIWMDGLIQSIGWTEVNEVLD